MKIIRICAVALLLVAVFSAFSVQVFATEDETPLISDKIHLQGDIDGNNSVNIKDVTFIRKHIAKFLELTDIQLRRANVDGLKNLDIKDASHLQKYLAKLEPFLFDASPVFQAPPAESDHSDIVLPVIPAQ